MRALDHPTLAEAELLVAAWAGRGAGGHGDLNLWGWQGEYAAKFFFTKQKPLKKSHDDDGGEDLQEGGVL